MSGVSVFAWWPAALELGLALGLLSIFDHLARWEDRPIRRRVVSLAGLLLALAPPVLRLATGPVAADPWFLLLAGVLTWKAVGLDYEWTKTPGNTRRWRVLAIGLCAASAVDALFLLPWAGVVIGRLCVWTHHAFMPLRLIFALVGLGLADQALDLTPWGSDAADVPIATALYLAVVLIHYWVPGLCKMALGPRWFSWVRHNTMHCIAVNAYLHGWLAFLPAGWVLRVGRALKPFDRPMQVAVLVIEAGAPLFFLSAPTFAVWLGLVAAMQVAIFLLTGLFFLEYITACVAAILLFPGTPDLATGVLAILLCGVFWAGRIIRPYKLAWWDSPICGKVWLEAELVDGRRVHVPNHALCPLERDYGQTRTLRYLDEKLPYWHLGEVENRATHTRLLAAGPDPAALARIAADEGCSNYEPRRIAAGLDELERIRAEGFFEGKRFLPRRLRWLKFPAEHNFHWGPRPALNPWTDRIRALELVFREHYATDERIVTIQEKTILRLDGGSAGPG